MYYNCQEEMVFGFLALYKLDGDDYSCFKRANFLIKLAVVCES